MVDLQATSIRSELFDLSGRVAIVTGAGSGLGRLFSEALAEAGAEVVCVGRTMDRLEDTVRSLAHFGNRAVAVVADVSDESAVQHTVATAIEQFGRLDIMVNNAGVAAVGPPEETSLADWRQVIDVNLTGVFIGARAAAQAMIMAGHGGRIINVASILGAVASEPMPATAYAASKGGVINLTRDLAVHWAPHGIQVNAIAPGYFPSEMTRDTFAIPEVLGEIEHRTPMGRVGRLEELKGPVLFLASDACSYVTGQTIFVDGGWTAW